MAILITGASGLLGRALMQRFSTQTPIGCAFSRPGKDLHQVDLTQPKPVTQLLEHIRPSVIIHAAAERRPDVCTQNEAKALQLNVDATRHLAQEAQRLGAYFLYISTDYVFDGTRPPYRPEDTPHPINFYGHSKLAGEQVVQSTLDRFDILRIGMLYGSVEHPGESAVTALLSCLDKTAPTPIDHHCQRYPIHTKDVAEACWHLVQNAQNHSSAAPPIWHWCSADPLTKYDMLNMMAKPLGKTTDHLQPMTHPIDDTPRPVDCALDCSALLKLGVPAPQPFKQGIKQVLESL